MSAAYDWYCRGLELLDSGDAHAAATVLERAAEAEPGKSSINEALARAYFRAGRFSRSLEQFRIVQDLAPTNDYAYFGAGLCLGRLGRIAHAVGQLRMANVMRPGNADYQDALGTWEALQPKLEPSDSSS